MSDQIQSPCSGTLCRILLLVMLALRASFVMAANDISDTSLSGQEVEVSKRIPEGKMHQHGQQEKNMKQLSPGELETGPFGDHIPSQNAASSTLTAHDPPFPENSGRLDGNSQRLRANLASRTLGNPRESASRDDSSPISTPRPTSGGQPPRQLPWESEAWQRDLDELETLLDMDITMEGGSKDAGGSSLSAGIGSDGQVVGMSSMSRAMNFFSPSPDPDWPFCSPAGLLYESGLVCPVMQVSAMILMRSPPDFEKLTSEHHCPNPEGALPMELEALNGKDGQGSMPMMIPPELVQKERPTYGWYLTHIYNMYAYAFTYADDLLTMEKDGDHHTLRPLIPHKWENQNVYFLKDPGGWKWPIGQSFTREQQMVVIFRGTMFPGGWETDFQTSYAAAAATARRGLPGRVHYGFFNFAEQFFEEFEKEVSLHGIKTITFAGHSLGGAISQVAAAFLVKHHRHLKIDCVTFGSPQVGDRTFTDFLNANVNLRRAVYVGSGQLNEPVQRGLNYGMGDVITQMPLACYNLSIPFCESMKFIENPDNLESFQFVMAAGNVPFYASDLRNTEGWLKKENYFFGARKFRDIPEGTMACHICSYACWTSEATGDSDTRCYFPGQGVQEAGELCSVDFMDSMTARFPNLEGSPVEGDLVHSGAVAGRGGGMGESPSMWDGFMGRGGRLRKT